MSYNPTNEWGHEHLYSQGVYPTHHIGPVLSESFAKYRDGVGGTALVRHMYN